MNNERKSMFRDIYKRQYSGNRTKTYEIAKGDESFVQRLGLIRNMLIHQGCVNSICWNDTGEYILSGSDDQHLVITNAHDANVKECYRTSHRANIFSAKFLPCTSDNQIVSCSGDGIILHTDLNRPDESCNNQFHCHGGTTTYKVVTIPNEPFTFVSCGEDGTLRGFDLRTKSSCFKPRCKDDILVSGSNAVTALAINPMSSHQLAAGCSDSTVRIYDRRFLGTQPGDHFKAQPFCAFLPPHFGTNPHSRITSLNFSGNGEDMLVSYSSEYLYLFTVQDKNTVQFKKPIRKLTPWEKLRAATGKRERMSPPPVRRLRLRGDWSDTGPDARPERDNTTTVSLGQARPVLQATLMQRMTDVLSRMLNDPMTRAALSAGGEDSLDETTRRFMESREREIASRNPDNVEGAGMDSDQAVRRSSSGQEPSSSNPENLNRSTITSHLHNHLTALRNLREGFIEQHGAEPSVSFRYSQQSTSNSTISLRVGREVNRTFGEDVLTAPSTSEGAAVSATSEPMNVDSEDLAKNVEEDKLERREKKSEEHFIHEAEVKMKYIGHRNSRTMIKEAAFWGDDYVMSGSDCGHVFIWNRETAAVKMLLQADKHVVNCLQPHPTLPLLATSGIDHDVKVWGPILEEPSFDEVMSADLINRNAIMLEETRDTITVPAAFMIRMLAALNQIRRGARNRPPRRREEEEG
nr:DDB1- and CUL4-associated factor 6-like [Leptinotarsa decemlineata]